jgi:hypothetical protein
MDGMNAPIDLLAATILHEINEMNSPETEAKTSHGNRYIVECVGLRDTHRDPCSVHKNLQSTLSSVGTIGEPHILR